MTLTECLINVVRCFSELFVYHYYKNSPFILRKHYKDTNYNTKTYKIFQKCF